MKKSKSSSPKMSKEERKLSIIQSSIFIFAQKGFHGTIVKDIAKHAGVSEALLYKHFSNKKEIYHALSEYTDDQIFLLINIFKGKKPSSKMLVEVVCCLIMMLITDSPKKTKLRYAFERLLIYSIVENPEYLEHFLLAFNREFSPLWEKCIQAAKKNNELKKNFKIKNSIWLIHHLALSINFLNIAGKKIAGEKFFPYKGTYEDLVKDTIQFALLGTGLKDEVIKKYYKPAVIQKMLPDVSDNI